MGGQDGSKPLLSEEEQEKKITSYEEAFLRIKEATGVSGTQEVVARFRPQGATQQHLKEQEQRRDEAADKLERASHVLVSVKAGVEHLADKLQHLKTMKSHVPTAHLSPSSDEYVLDLLSVSEEKLLKLLEDLDGRELVDILRQMEEEEFHSSIENKLPSYNVRVALPAVAKHDSYDEDDDSGDDDTAAPTRADLKRRAQQIIDSK